MKDTRTNEELNRIIAEWMGWKPYSAEGRLEWDGQGYSRTPILPPSYCTDLNVIHEAVQHLFKSKPWHWDGYWFCILHEIVTGRDVIEQGWEITDSTSCSETTEATARQRAEALVAVIEGGTK